MIGTKQISFFLAWTFSLPRKMPREVLEYFLEISWKCLLSGASFSGSVWYVRVCTVFFSVMSEEGRVS